jgi:hypothetical protein
MTSAEELRENIGKTGMLTVSGTALKFSVLILDARSRYGHLDYKVRPIAGDGEQWHQSDSVTNVIEISLDKHN